MSWFVVGGIAIGATAGAIVGSKKGGDDVWKDALIGGAIGGTAGYGAGALGAAEAAAPAAVAGEGGTGILGAEAVAGGSGLALGGAGLETGGAMAGGASGAGIVGAEGAAAGAGGAAGSSGMGLGQAGGFGSGASFGGSGTSFGTYGGAAVPEGGGLMNAGFAPGMQAPIQMIEAPAASDLAQVTASPQGDIINGVQTGANKTGYSLANQSPLEKGFGSAMSWLSEPKNAMFAGVLGLGALSMFNNNEDNFGDSNVTPAGYPLSPNFKPSRYQPTRTYAEGGMADAGSQNRMFPQSQIPDRTQFANPTQMPASMEVLRSDYDATINPYTGDETRFAKGGDTSKYQAMIDPRMNVQTPDTPDWVRSRGIYTDADPDTKYQDALTAAQTRMGKAASRANVKLGAMQKPTPMGKLNLGPVVNNEKQKANTAEDDGLAGGGITSLGGYAHGGNARLLRGPGDGMSDDIPATIADKQPARLADGEFVVPADVVSGLGNGSTEAGAKKLHEMMDKVRVDRTGTKKQGKQINADKYVPGAKAEKKASGGIAGYADGGGVDYSQYYVYDAMGNQIPMSNLLSATQAQTTPVSSTANTKPTGYNPDYYNPQLYQNQLDAANKAIQQAQSQIARPTSYGQSIGTEGQTINLQPGTQVVYGADGRYSAPVTVGESGRIDLSNQIFGDPNVGVIKQAYLYDPNVISAQDLEAANKLMTEQQPLQQAAQQNLQRLQNTATAYTPYTIANRPSAAEPQFYGNIYQENYRDYARPGYDMNANLGVWNNEYGRGTAATPRQEKIYNIAAGQAATGQADLQKAQAAAQQALKPKEETKKRKGGILAAKKK